MEEANKVPYIIFTVRLLLGEPPPAPRGGPEVDDMEIHTRQKSTEQGTNRGGGNTQADEYISALSQAAAVHSQTDRGSQEAGAELWRQLHHYATIFFLNTHLSAIYVYSKLTLLR